MSTSSKSAAARLDAAYAPERQNPLYEAMVTHLKGRQRAASECQNLYQEAYAAFLQEQQDLRTEAWKTVTESHSALVAAASDDNGGDAHQAAYLDTVRAQQEFCSGDTTKDAFQAAYDKFHASVAEIAEVASRRIAAGERHYIKTLKEAVASIDPDALDQETLSLFQQAVQAASPTATLVAVAPTTDPEIAPAADPDADPESAPKGGRPPKGAGTDKS